ncbi:MAG: hypothetical protein NVS1B1_07440 [Candidatus Limnocylindrales bacterium]
MGDRVTLRRAGRTYKGLCPFHAEKTPSFTVDPDRRTFKCFGCGEGGDCFDWLVKTEGLDKVDALKALAEKAGIELTGGKPPGEREREKRLFAAHDAAHFYFRQALRGTDKGKAAAAYVAERGIAAESVETFGIGYAPDLTDGLLGYLRKKGHADTEIIATGLVVETERALIDRFRDRLIVPIRDGRGRIIAFGGRAMRADQRGKYINSPQTSLFSKSATLYGLDVAKAAIRKGSEAVIVEGYFDAIAAHQAGFANVVASMGTALTQDQYRLLDDLHIDRAIVAFDGDAAGQRSAEARGRELLKVVQPAASRSRKGTVDTTYRLEVYVTILPEGTDPDEMARRDPEGLRALIAGAKPLLEFVINQVQDRVGRERLATADGRRRFLEETLPLLADEPDPIRREVYLGTLSAATGLDQAALRSQAAAARIRPQGPQAPDRPGRQDPAAGTAPVPEAVRKQVPSLERYLMAQLVQFPEEAARTDLDPADLADPDHRAIFEHLRSVGRSTAGLPAHLAATAASLGANAPEPGPGVVPGQEIEILALRLREANLRGRLGEARAGLARQDAGAGDLDLEVARLASDLAELMRTRERRTMLRSGQE